MLENIEGAIKRGHFRETDNIDEEKQNKLKTQYNMCWHHYTQTNTNKVNKTGV